MFFIKYRNEIKRLKEKVNKLQEMVGDPKYVLQKLLKDDISAYDWAGIKDKEKRNGYAQEAKRISNSYVLQNEIKMLYGDLVKEIAMESQNFEIVLDLRMTINGAKLIMERLESIGEDNRPTNKEPHKAT
jgi:DUF438 domain-containing protein